MQPTDKQLKKLEKLSYLKNDAEVVILESIDEVQTNLEDKINSVSEELSGKIESLATQLSEIPDHSEHMSNMMNKLNDLENEEITVELVIK